MPLPSRQLSALTRLRTRGTQAVKGPQWPQDKTKVETRARMQIRPFLEDLGFRASFELAFRSDAHRRLSETLTG